jgi:uncharacterized protein
MLANTVTFFNGRALLPMREALARNTRADEVARVALLVLVHGKFQTLLTFLFGLGFALQLARSDKLGRSVVPLYLRRLGVLFAIGVAHVVLLWWGDVVWGYALTGVALLLFRRRTNRALLVWAALLIVIPQILRAVPPVAAFVDGAMPGPRDRALFKAELFATLSRADDYAHLVHMQVLRGFYYFMAGAPWYIPWMLGRFLLGFVVGRNRLLEETATRLPLWRRLLAWGLAIGLTCGIAKAFVTTYVRRGGTLSPWWELAFAIPDEAGVLALSLAYLAALVLLMQKPSWQRRLMVLAPAGQMALTNYVGQSAVSTFIFYGWGLGLIGRVGPALCIPLTLVIFAGQLVISEAWLRHFQFGPLEWLWRSLTYGKRQPMRRAVSAPAML